MNDDSVLYAYTEAAQAFRRRRFRHTPEAQAEKRAALQRLRDLARQLKEPVAVAYWQGRLNAVHTEEVKQ